MLTNFDIWLTEMVTDGLELSEDVNEEAIKNMWALSFPVEELPAPDELTRFIGETVALRRSQVQSLGAIPATFYLWYDAQAGQLRFSVARCRPDSLPFGCAVTLSEEPEEIIRQYLESANPDGTVPGWQVEHENFYEPAPDDVPQYCQIVWACSLA